jgi:hypothetical protein
MDADPGAPTGKSRPPGINGAPVARGPTPGRACTWRARQPQILERVLIKGLIPSHPWEQPAIFVEESLAALNGEKERS